MSPALLNLGAQAAARGGEDSVVLVAVDRDGNERAFSGREMETRVRAVAAMLARRGLAPGSRIGILGANSGEYLAACLGTMRAGYVSVPINQRQPSDTIHYILADAGIGLVFADAEGGARLGDGVEVMPLDELPDDAMGFSEATISTEDPAMILYTSGSTGKPKGVVLSHRSQLAMVENVISGPDRAFFQDRTGIVAAPMFHMNALVFLASLLCGGGKTVLMSKFDAPLFAQLIKKHRVNLVTGVPTMITVLYDALPRLNAPDFSSVTTVYIGSAPVTEAVVRQAKEMMPNAAVINSYGTTESGGGLFGPHPDGIPRPPTSVGYPRSNVGLRLEGDGASGVLQVNARSAMSGYLNLPELTAERFSDGWFDTRDIFQVDADGFFYFIGRADDMFVCSGENIYPGEVEKIIESHPAVVQASVVPVADRVRGQMPVAWVVSADAALDEDAIKQHVLAHAAPHLHPRRVWFLDQLPLNGAGKIDRRALSQRAEAAIQSESPIIKQREKAS
jgi:long-chain acyl-CoA synthetase